MIERLDVVEEPRKEWELRMEIAAAPPRNRTHEEPDHAACIATHRPAHLPDADPGLAADPSRGRTDTPDVLPERDHRLSAGGAGGLEMEPRSSEDPSAELERMAEAGASREPLQEKK